MAWDDELVGSDVVSAGRLVSECIAKDVSRHLDLEEALEASRYTSHPYSSYPKEWPSFVEVLETQELPPTLIERYNASGGEGTALCGIFPEIHCAWASVDNSMFLWRFNKWDGHCPEYSGEEQAICAVALARSKPGIFVEAIQYLLVLATPVELLLIGVCCTANGDGTDPYAEISLQPLPEYRMSSDGVTMTCIVTTEKGHIYLAGRDGHIYEIQYTTGSGWCKRCPKVCLTTGLGTLISRLVLPDAFKFAAVDPIVDMVIDNERYTIYARTEGMKLQAFDLGVNGDGPFKKIAEDKSLIDPRTTRYWGRQSNGPRMVSQAVKPSIVSIAPLASLESRWLHMVAILSDGRRLYLSTYPSGGNSGSVGGLTGLSNGHQRPCCLKVVATRPSPPLGVSGGLTFGAVSAAGRMRPEDLALQVETAFYSSGTLLLSDSSASSRSSLLIVKKDSASMQSSLSSGLGMTSKSSHALRELVSSLPLEGRMLSVADVLPPRDTALAVQSLYSDAEAFPGIAESCEKASVKLWGRGDLPTQHILPRRKLVVFSTMGLIEVAFNRPVDILRRLLETNAPQPQVEDFFNRFGPGEAAAMCLILAAKLLYADENLVSNSAAERAAEIFEDPGIVGMPQLQGSNPMSSARSPAGDFSMGQVVQEAEPVFSSAHEGLCLCSSRLLFPIWELPVMIVPGEVVSDVRFGDEVVVSRLSSDAMQILESKIRSLEQFLRSRRNRRRGLYGNVAGRGDFAGSVLYGAVLDVADASPNTERPLFAEPGDSFTVNKRQRLYTSVELASMEVRAMECLRRLLRRSCEALFLLQLISHHNVTRLVQGLDSSLRQRLVQLTFSQLVCSEEGDQLAMQLISRLMEYYIGADGRGTVDDISAKLREGCPSYFNEPDYKYFLAVECLERAAVTVDANERESLAREAYNYLTKIPETADLSTVCKRFEELRFYEAVVQLPLLKARAFDPEGDLMNGNIDPDLCASALNQRQQCYEIITNALRSLKGEVGQRGTQKELGTLVSVCGTGSVLDPASRDKFIRQIIQLSVQWPDTTFHEHLYKTLIELGLENELLEYGGSDLVSFLHSAGRKPLQETQAVASVTPTSSPLCGPEASLPSSQTKYLDLLAKYYVMKRQHFLAAKVLYMLAERDCTDAEEAPTLEQRCQYLSNAVLQAKSASSSGVAINSMKNNVDNDLLDMLEAKLAVLRFQMRIKENLELMASKSEGLQGSGESSPIDQSTQGNLETDAEISKAAGDKAKELALGLKSITQLYNDYAVPFKLWEICLEILNFAKYPSDGDTKIVRETWLRLLDQAISRGGVAEACSVLKRVGSNLYLGDGSCLPLDTICLHLEKAAMERLTSGAELVGDEDVARALLAACKGAHEPVLSVYDQLLSNGPALLSPTLRLRLLRSVLVVLREWTLHVLASRTAPTTSAVSYRFNGSLALEQATMLSQGIRDKIASAANRYMTEVRRLPLPQSQTEHVYRGFRELEEKLSTPSFPLI